MKKVYGIHAPRTENKQSVLHSAGKYGLMKNAIVTSGETAYKPLLMHIGNALPEGLIFNRKGEHIAYKATDTSCNAGLFGFIPSLKDSSYRKTQEPALNEVISQLHDLEGHALPADYLSPTADYYLFLFWACFEGRLNKDHVKQWQDLAAANKHARIQVILVNMDKQQWWQNGKNRH